MVVERRFSECRRRVSASHLRCGHRPQAVRSCALPRACRCRAAFHRRRAVGVFPRGQLQQLAFQRQRSLRLSACGPTGRSVRPCRGRGPGSASSAYVRPPGQLAGDVGHHGVLQLFEELAHAFGNLRLAADMREGAAPGFGGAGHEVAVGGRTDANCENTRAAEIARDLGEEFALVARSPRRSGKRARRSRELSPASGSTSDALSAGSISVPPFASRLPT